MAPRLLNKHSSKMRFDPEDEIKPYVHTLELKAILVVDDDQQLASALQ